MSTAARPIVFCVGCARVVYLARDWRCSLCGRDVLSGEEIAMRAPSPPAEPELLPLCACGCAKRVIYASQLFLHAHGPHWNGHERRQFRQLAAQFARIPKGELGELVKACLLAGVRPEMAALVRRLG